MKREDQILCPALFFLIMVALVLFLLIGCICGVAYLADHMGDVVIRLSVACESLLKGVAL